MKKLSLVLFSSLLAAASSFAAGAVSFYNDPMHLSSPPDRLIRYDIGIPNQYGTNYAPAVGTNYFVQLFYGGPTATESDLISVTDAPATLRTASTSYPGAWTGGGPRILYGFNPADTVTLQVRCWDSTYASTWAGALAAGQGLAGESSLFSYFVPEASDGAVMDNFTGFTISELTTIPEPSTVCLSVLAVGALGLRLRLRRAK